MTTEGTRAPEADYLAVILIGCGSSWGRARDKNEAIANAIQVEQVKAFTPKWRKR